MKSLFNIKSQKESMSLLPSNENSKNIVLNIVKLAQEKEQISRNKTSSLNLNLKAISHNINNYTITTDRNTYFDSNKSNAIIINKNNYFKDLFSNQYLNQNEKDISYFLKSTRNTNSRSKKDVSFSNTNYSSSSKILIK